MNQILIFSDLHLSNWAYGSSINTQGYNSRLWAQFQAAMEMINDAKERGVKTALFTGDLTHTHGRLDTAVLDRAATIFKELRRRGIQICAIAGNHDMASRSGTPNSLSFLADEEISGHWVVNDLEVRGMAYSAAEEPLKQFLGEAGGGERPRLLLMHQGVSGVPLASGYMLDERLTPEMIPDNCIAAVGHYHQYKQVSERLIVPGSLTPLTWGDIDNPKGWILYDLESGKVEQRLQSKAPVFMTWSESIAKHSSLENVNNAFVRYTDAVSLKQQEKIRAELREAGALTVEFPTVKLSKKQSEIRSGDTITIEHLAKQFEEGIEGRRLEVGIEVREGKYSAAR